MLAKGDGHFDYAYFDRLSTAQWTWMWGTAQMEDEWWCLFVKNGDRLSCMERHQGDNKVEWI